MIGRFRQICAAILAVSLMILVLGSCGILFEEEATKIYIKGGDRIEVTVGSTYQLEVEANGALYNMISWESSNSFIEVSERGVINAQLIGTGIITASYGDYSDTVIIAVVGATDGSNKNDQDTDGSDKNNGDEDKGDVIIPADKYKNMSAAEFYADYEPAVSLLDAKLRSEVGFMSGSITVPPLAPVPSDYQPMSGGKYVRNTATYFSDDGSTYTVVNAYGEEVLKIYKGGGYITLEEVAAYVYAFGEIPANYDANKNNKTVSSSPKSEWGKYLRLNDSNFSGSTTKYPYEPELPNISGCGGSLKYYEIDIGTTAGYNNGTKISRGAARIVYVKFDGSRRITDPNERYVFYTYNHYNDFQEYLNYYGGWGEMFGNVTGGGIPSDKYNCNPTPYVETAYDELEGVVAAIAFIFPYAQEKRYA